MTDAQDDPKNDDPLTDAALAYQQALKYGKDLANIYVEEKAKRQKLEVAYQTLDAVFASTPDGLVVLDESLTIQRANTAFGKLVEKEPEALFNQRLDSVLPPEDIAPLLAQLENESKVRHEVELIMRKPRRRAVLITAARLSAGQLRGWVLAFRDHSRARRMEHQKAEFINLAAHELRTPLTTVMSYLDLLRRQDQYGVSQEQALEAIGRGAARLKNVIGELLHFAELNQADLQPQDIVEFKVSEVAEDVVSELKQHADENLVTLQVFAPESNLYMTANAALLRSALYQLVLNSINFNIPGGFVRIEAGRSSSEIQVRVIDTGIGIPQTDLEMIFEPFHQAEKPVTPNSGGLGLGISIARNAVERLGGTLGVEQTSKSGTTFTLRLPLRQPSPQAELDELRTQLGNERRQALAYAHDLQTLYRQLQRTNRQLKDINLQLEEANKLKTNFLGIVSHELLSPFAGLDMALQAFPRYGTKGLTSEQQELFEQVAQGISTIRQMVARLVNYAGLLSKQGKLNLGFVNISTLIGETVTASAPLALRRGLKLEAEAPENLILPSGDHERIGEAVWHLVQNGIKFTPSGGHILVRAYEHPDFVAIEVKDTGVGIPQEKQATIWDAFAQMADPLKRGVEGLGLGLALVRYVAAAHGGDVTLQSEPGVGSVIGFWLPTEPADFAHS